MVNSINSVNSTSFRIMASVVTTCIICIMLVAAILFFGWEPNAIQMMVLYAVGGGLRTMMGYDVVQFVGKRWTDIDFQKARNPPGKVDVENVEQVNVTTDPSAPKREPGLPDDGAVG